MWYLALDDNEPALVYIVLTINVLVLPLQVLLSLQHIKKLTYCVLVEPVRFRE